MMQDDQTDVVVVGAGPVGLLLTSELRRRGASVRVVDRSAGTKSISKALIQTMRLPGTALSLSTTGPRAYASGVPPSVIMLYLSNTAPLCWPRLGESP